MTIAVPNTLALRSCAKPTRGLTRHMRQCLAAVQMPAMGELLYTAIRVARDRSPPEHADIIDEAGDLIVEEMGISRGAKYQLREIIVPGWDREKDSHIFAQCPSFLQWGYILSPLDREDREILR